MNALTIRDMDIAAIESLFVPEDERKVNLDILYLNRLKEKNPELQVEDFAIFIQKAQLSGADPRKDQIYLTSYNGQVWNPVTQQKKYQKVATIIFAYHFFISKADTHKQYDGYETKTGVAEYIDGYGKVSKQGYADCFVYRKDRSRPTEYRAWFSEFAKFKDGSPTAQWKKPMMMLTKCAVCNAHRLAFPDELGMMTTEYDREENEEITEPITVQNESVDVKKDEIKEEKKVIVPEVVDEKPKEEEKKKEEVVKPVYICAFGPHKGKKITEVPPSDLTKYSNFLASEAKRRGKVNPMIQEFLNEANKLI